MKKTLKKIVSILAAFVFAFSPLFFAGCDLSVFDDAGGAGGNSQNEKKFNVNDYLGAIKMSYTHTISSDQDDNQDDMQAVKEYAKEVSSLAQIQAADILTQLFFMYGNGHGENLQKLIDNNGKICINDISLTYVLIPLYGNNISKDFSTEEGNWNFFIKYEDDENIKERFYNTYANPDFGYKMSSTNGADNFIKFIGCGDIDSNYEANLQNHKGSAITNTGLLTYAILSIIDNFWNISVEATESEFNTAFNRFIASYETFKLMNKENQEAEIERLSLNVKHSGIIPNSMEEKALIKFVRNYVVGENLVVEDNRWYQVWDNVTQSYINSTEITNCPKFQGESYYYNPNATYNPSSSNNDVSIYIHGQKSGEDIAEGDEVDYVDGTLEALQGVKGRLEELYADEKFKLWQDINNDGFADIVMVEGTNIPKFRPLEDLDEETEQKYCFKNYEYTIEQIVKNVAGNTDSLINNKTTIDEQDPSTYVTQKTEKQYYLVSGGVVQANNSIQVNQAIVSNVFSKDYTFSQIEAAGEGENACVLPQRAYKSMLICALDRSDKEEKNNAGIMVIVAESSKGVQVNLKFYARYYRLGSGFAQWYNSDVSQYTEFYELNNGEMQSVNGPYTFEYNQQTGQYEEGCFFEMDINQFFKDAKFGEEYTANNKTFNYTYTDLIDGKEHTEEIYELEMFPDDYYDKNPDPTNYSHSSIFVQDYKNSPKYDSLLTHRGEQVYCYSAENFTGIESDENYAGKDIGFLEIVLVSDSDNPFTIGIAGYVPQTALLG